MAISQPKNTVMGYCFLLQGSYMISSFPQMTRRVCARDMPWVTSIVQRSPSFRFSHVIQGYPTSTVNHLNMRLSGFIFHFSPFLTLLLTSLPLWFLLLDLASEPANGPFILCFHFSTPWPASYSSIHLFIHCKTWRQFFQADCQKSELASFKVLKILKVMVLHKKYLLSSYSLWSRKATVLSADPSARRS